MNRTSCGDECRRFLESYRDAAFESKRLRRRMAMLKARCESVTRDIGCTNGSRGADQRHDNALIAYDAVQRSFLASYSRSLETMREVSTFIDGIEDPCYRRILQLRYVDGMTWVRIQQTLSESGYAYTDRHLFRLHGMALNAARHLYGQIHAEE